MNIYMKNASSKSKQFEQLRDGTGMKLKIKWSSVGCLVLFWLTCMSLGLGACSSEGQSCTRSEECAVGFFCRTDGVCQAGCRLSIECSAGQVCSLNQCVKVQKDEDKDGFPKPLDCDDTDRFVNPGLDEICGNKKDDNCDGKVDEDGCKKVDCRPGETQECYEGKKTTLTFPGTHCKKGRQTCMSSGVWGDCQGQILPAPESCDNQDNDCNGKIDDGESGKPLTRTCYSGPVTTRKQGECKEGRQTCSKGKWEACSGEKLPQIEQCSGKDDNCDGQIDNVKDVGTPCDTGAKGLCGVGQMGCDDKTKTLKCQSSYRAQSEVCNDQKDNDCDGLIDNGCPYVAQKAFDAASFPHYVTTWGSWLAVSLRQTRRIDIYNTQKQPLQRLHSVVLPAEPYGLQMDKAYVYVTSKEALYRIDLTTGQHNVLVSFAKKGHDGALLLRNGRLFTRRWDVQNTQGGSLDVCQTNLATQKTLCTSVVQNPKAGPQGIATWGIYVLLLSEKGLHFIDILKQVEETQRFVALPAHPYAIAVDPSKNQAVITSSVGQNIFLVDLASSQIKTELKIQNKQGQTEPPGHVLQIDGRFFVAHEKGKALSELDTSQKKVIRSFDVCLAPHGLALGQKTVKGQRIWIACPGDQSVSFVMLGL